ncbi:MAG: nucleotidyltransferase domain-containing protein [candidate division Zixibacteria bacterium]|nr:nucleotidyltransferase domain-containing protein [candidate division Zixibacteria bacterium]
MDDLKKILPDLKARLRERYGERLVKLVLFGSHARGEATEDSDVDVLAVLAGLENAADELFAASEDAADVSFDHDTLIGLVLASEEEYATKNTPLLLSVRREGAEI